MSRPMDPGWERASESWRMWVTGEVSVMPKLEMTSSAGGSAWGTAAEEEKRDR